MKNLIRGDLKVMDGGMGKELAHQFPDEGFKNLWSAYYLWKNPQAVIKCHLDFINAGARVIITNNYACIPYYLEKCNLIHKMFEFIRKSGQLAQEAKKKSGNEDLIIAGSIPPYDGSYRGGAMPNKEPIIKEYLRIAYELSPFVDVFLIETMTSYDEAVTALSGMIAILYVIIYNLIIN